MIPCHQYLINPPERSEPFHKFLLSEHKELVKVYNSNIDKLKGLLKVLIDLQGPEKPSNLTTGQDANLPWLSTEKSYNAELELFGGFPDFVCKSKYFQINAKLITKNFTVKPEHRFIVIASLYTVDETPSKVGHALNGRNIFRGNTRETLAFDNQAAAHIASFRLQIKEVSSHFPSGAFHLVLEVERLEDCPELIVKPYVIGNLRVRAKEYYLDMLKSLKEPA